MNDSIRERLAKVNELVKRGVGGEQKAAQKALERLKRKYNISEEEMAKIGTKEYRFKYATKLDQMLFLTLLSYFDIQYHDLFKDTWGKKELTIRLEYLDYVTLSCSYEYFRGHMRKQFNRLCTPKINRCRSSRTRNKRREELQTLFFSQYVIKSKLYKEGELRPVEKLTQKEYEDRKALRDVEGGNYKTQVSTGLYLDI